MVKDLYSVLEVHPKASSEVIDAAFKALMKKVHPDTGASSTGTRAKSLNEAHDILVDSIKRDDYDKSQVKSQPKQIGPYKLIDVIAEGGFGRTYKAKHNLLDEFVCVKDCSNVSLQDTQMLIDECKTVWDLRHYAIPAMRDLIQMKDGRVLLVMSYIPGPTLEQIVKKHGAIDPEHVCWITERILNACMYLHRSGVVHGDIKPQNIIVQPEKHMAVLVDYGLSLVKPTSRSESKGYTPFFAAPEAVEGKPLLPESDYYSIGMTMIFALSGGTDYVEKKEVPASVANELCNFIRKMIAKSVANRPQYPKEDIVDTFVHIREKVFGRRSSNLKPLKY
jgi:serine/threonine protein kinase